MTLVITEDVADPDDPAAGAGESGAVTASDLDRYVGADGGADATDVARAFVQADSLVLDFLADAWRPVPRSFVNRMVLEVGHEIFKRRESPTGGSQYAVPGQGAPTRGPRDPLAVVRPDLLRYVRPL